MADSPHSEQLGNRYHLLSRLSKQAGRETFLAQDEQTRQQVVIKRLTFDTNLDWDDLKLFEREAETLKSLSHPGIPRYLDAFEIDTSTRKGYALVQSFIDAKTLDDYLKAGCIFSEADIKQIVRALLDILDYLHQRLPPVIHRDIKPSNILMTATADARIDHVYLVDFGSVHTLASKEGQTVTVVGTYGYMPPEQFGGQAVPASDLYSVGAVAIALATGKHPAELPQKNLRLQFKPHVNLSDNFMAWLTCMVEPNLARRFASVEQARSALDHPRWAQLQNRAMTTQRLFWNALYRSTLTGALAGLACGAAVGSIIFPVIGTLLLMLVGLMMGVPTGIGNGLFIGLITRLWFFPLKNPRRYQQTITFASTLLITVMITVGLAMITDMLSSPEILIVTLIPGIFGGLSMGVATRAIAQWYIDESQAQLKDDG
ncbi:MAG: serine/threonine protein kinase [Elainellaceae cyanobacterium]